MIGCAARRLIPGHRAVSEPAVPRRCRSSSLGERMQTASAHRVVVVGGGFGGLQAAMHLRRAPVEVTLVDRRNFHLFQPLTYQVATGALSPGEVAYPLRAIFRRARNVRVLMAEAHSIDLDGAAGRARVGRRRAGAAQHPLRHADRRRRLELLLLRPRGVGRVRARGQVAGERARDPVGDPRGVRGGGDGPVRGASRLLALVRGRRRRPDGRRDGRADRRAGARQPAARLPLRRPGRTAASSWSRPATACSRASRLRCPSARCARCERIGRDDDALTDRDRRRRSRRHRARAERRDRTHHARTVVWAAGVTASPLAGLLASARPEPRPTAPAG